MIRLGEAVSAKVPAVIRRLSNEPLGIIREGADPGTCPAAFDNMAAESGNRLIVAEELDEIVGCSQITVVPGRSLSAARHPQIEGVRVAACRHWQGTGAALMAMPRRWPAPPVAA